MAVLVMEIALTPELQGFIEEKVRSGRYLDATDVVRDALRNLDREREHGSLELEPLILEGVESPHEPLTEATCEEIRRSAQLME